MLQVFEPGALNYFTFFRPTLSILSASRNPILTHFPLSGFLVSLPCVLFAPTLGLAFSLVMPRTLVGGHHFFLAGLFFFELSTFSLSSLDPYSDYVGVNIFLKNFSSLSFLNVYASPICCSPTDGRTDCFSSSILFSSRNLCILEDFNCHIPSGTQEVLPTPAGRKYSIGSSPLTSFPSMTLAHPPFSIAPLAFASLLTFLLLPSLLPFLAPGKCFRTWVLTTYQFFYLSLSLRSFAPTSVPLPSTFRKLAGMTLSPTLTLTVHLQRYTHLFPLLLLSLLLWH